MKKAILSIGLFTLVLATTSFAAPTVSTSSIADNAITTPIDGNGGQDTGGNKKVDVYGGDDLKITMKQYSNIDGNGGQDTGGNKKVD